MKNLLFGTAVLFFTGIVNPVFSQKSETPKFISNTEGVKEYSLNNGMRLLLISDASQSNMIVNIVYNVGSKDEGYGEKGMAHLLEHMLFKSTKSLGDIKKQLSDKGGQANGTTWFDRTNYYEIFPSNDENLKWSLQMEADRMVNATILQTDLDKEFSVVRNEFEIGENNPTRVMIQNVFSNAYTWHNYGNSTIGSKEDIERVKSPTLRKFYEKYYQPDNATLIIAGKFDEKSALKYVEDYFSVLKKPDRNLGGTYTVEPAQNGEKYFEIKRNNDQQIIAAGYHASAFADKDYAALSALYEILASDPSGYLYKNLVDTQRVSSIWTFSPVVRDPGMVYLNFDVPKDKNLDETTELVRKELDNVSSIKFSQDDLKRAQAKLIKGIENERNNTIDFAINLTEIVGAGNYKLGFLYRDNIENLKLEDINRVAQKYFKNNNRTIGVFRPSSNEERVFPLEFRDQQIADLVKNYKGKTLEKEPAPFEASIANVKKNLTEGKLSNGMKYGLIHKELKGDKVQGTFRFRIGNEKDLEGKQSIGSMAASLLKAGTKTKTKEHIQDELDQMKSSVGTYMYGQDLVVNIDTYKQYYPKVMAILQDMLSNATFPENELTKTITETNTWLEGQLKDPDAIANNELQRLAAPYLKTSIFYVSSLQEQIDNNKKVTKAQVEDFYKNIMGASDGVGTLISSIDAKTASSELEKTFGKFIAKSKFAEVKPTFFETKKQDKNIITPDKENAVAFGTSSFKMTQDHPDYAALVMANEILGNGGFLSARLPMRLREKDGISYGVGSYLNIPVSNDVASWNYYAYLNPTKRDAVEAAVKEEVSKAIASGFTQQELDSNKKSYSNERITSLGTDYTLINLVNTQLLYGRSLDKYDEQNAKIQKLTLSEVNAAVKKYLSENNVISVFAGDFNKK
ncbi:putative zinc protease [Chryseobacterium aquaeductus]|uniref:Zinc protease n=1 Tax=Chryseobacterium aquaeductus TaxID=2675056 RepID=A0A9N8QSC6_9FLAO|nr:pitrilysin family protein [Chryseobacterium aquaeductus]CAA7331167.1 putative zinc protease [Chryseobacterium potabilaquae]CAD7808580.1 putative zinc protease [Chryseobacterium aquaeductus]